VAISRNKQKRIERRRVRQIEKVTDVLKRGAVSAFLAVNTMAFVEGAITVTDARQKMSVADIQIDSVADRAKLAFLSTDLGALEGIILGAENYGGAYAINPCERSYLMSCQITQYLSDNNGFNKPQAVYQVIGGLGYTIGGLAAGLVDGTVGVPKMKLSR
jgi:hypothetical protein